MSQSKLVSIIVPMYNAEKTIAKTAKSLIGQTYKELEIILIDDGSTDSTPDIIDSLVDIHRNIKVVHTPNRGVSSARNTGLDIACGEYVGFVDSDDWVEPDMYQLMVDNMNQNEADLCACDYFVEPTGLYKKHTGGIIQLSKNEALGDILQEGKLKGYLWNKIFKKDLIKSKFDEQILQCEDMIFLAEYIINAESVIYIDVPLYHYWRSSGVGKEISKRAITLLDAYKKLIPLYKENAEAYQYIVEKKLLKAALNYKSRIPKSSPSEYQIKISDVVDEYFKKVIIEKNNKVTEKINIVLSRYCGRLMRSIKDIIIQINHFRGHWES